MPDVQVMTARTTAGSADGLFLAVKGGHNREHHNHNDVGTYVVALAGKAPFLDPGREEYTGRTFSSQRYESNVLNSYGHPVPRVAGKLQSQGRSAAVRVVETVFTDEMDTVADLAERYSYGELRVTHEQNLVLPHVRRADLAALWQALRPLRLASGNVNLVSDIIACPGLDYCSLANARSIPVAQALGRRFADQARQDEIGELHLNISGCINACGHHHVGHIGILGVDKKGKEFYQVTLGGSADEDAALGRLVGPAFASDTVVDAVETVVDTYLDLRRADERFIDTYRRVGLDPFKERLYADL